MINSTCSATSFAFGSACRAAMAGSFGSASRIVRLCLFLAQVTPTSLRWQNRHSPLSMYSGKRLAHMMMPQAAGSIVFAAAGSAAREACRGANS